MQQILLVSFSNSPNFQNELFCISPKIFLIYIKSKDNHILSNLITPDSLAYSAVHLTVWSVTQLRRRHRNCNAR